MRIYTDGASANNQIQHLREGGYAFLICGDQENEIFYCYEKGATNNRMELMAFLSALEYIMRKDIRPEELDIYTDSSYLIGCFSGNKIKKNQDLIFSINCLIGRLKGRVNYHYVSGHNGDPCNELCDQFAKQAIIEKNTEIRSRKLGRL